MPSLRDRSKSVVVAGLLLLSVFGSFYQPENAQAQKSFARKGCLDCHKKFEEKYFSID